MWRVRRLLDRAAALIPTAETPTEAEPAPAPETELAAAEVQPVTDSRPEPRGLWMPREQPWAYIVVPKAACTTAGQYLFYADHGYYYYDDVHRMRYGLLKAGVDSHAVREQIDALGDDLFTFSFVRDPYARLVSAFLDKVVDLEQGYRGDIRDHLTADWGVQLTGDRSQTDDFKAFVRFVDYQYQKWIEFQALEPGQPDPRAPWEIVDIHWLRQSWYMRRGRTHTGSVDFIGSVETMTADLEQITDRMAPPHVPPLSDMPKFGAGPKREAPLEDFYDDETKAIVDRHFRADFRLFGYPMTVGAPPEQLDGFERAARYEDRRVPAPDEPEDTDDDALPASDS